jgi:hypothetical protein
MQFFSLAQCVGYVALVLGVTAFRQKDDRRLKLFLAAECAAYTVHFSLLGKLTAALSTGTSGARCLIALKTQSRWVAALMLAINLLIGACFARSLLGWLPVVSSCLGTIAVFLLQGITMRLVLLSSTLLWLGNNLACGSIGGTVLETLIALSNLSTIIRLWRPARLEADV